MAFLSQIAELDDIFCVNKTMGHMIHLFSFELSIELISNVFFQLVFIS